MYKYSCDLAKSIAERVHALKMSNNWMTWKHFTRFAVRYSLTRSVKNIFASFIKFHPAISSRFSEFRAGNKLTINSNSYPNRIYVYVYVYACMPFTHTYIYGFILRFGFSYRCPINLSTLIIISVSYRWTNGPIKATEKLMPGPAEWGLMLIKNKL